jgi:hypothetical protein
MGRHRCYESGWRLESGRRHSQHQGACPRNLPMLLPAPPMVRTNTSVGWKRPPLTSFQVLRRHGWTNECDLPVIRSLYALRTKSWRMTMHYAENTITCRGDYRRGLEWRLDLLSTRLGTASSYSATANLHSTRFSSLLCLHQPFPGNGL